MYFVRVLYPSKFGAQIPRRVRVVPHGDYVVRVAPHVDYVILLQTSL